MLNPAAEKLVINNYMASYTMLYAQHNFYLDDDVVSKVAFYKTGSLEKTAFFPVTEKLYTFFTLKELTSNSAYTLNPPSTTGISLPIKSCVPLIMILFMLTNSFYFYLI